MNQPSFYRCSIALIFTVAVTSTLAVTQAVELPSPDGRLVATIELSDTDSKADSKAGQCVTYSVTLSGQTIVEKSRLGLETEGLTLTEGVRITTPWRVIMAGSSGGELLENNSIFLNLNDPCAIEDTSWIKPGKVIREVTLATAGGKACVDFAAAHGLQFVHYDAGWYGHEYDDASDATTISVDPKCSKGPLDLHQVIDYAERRGVDVIVYVNRRALEKQLDEILPLYRSWGIAGVKYGFVNVGSQQWTDWLHDAIRKAAEHRLMVDVHDEYRPTGYERTYPNLMTAEGIAGDETSPANSNTLTILFTRMLCGPADNTICYYVHESPNWPPQGGFRNHA